MVPDECEDRWLSKFVTRQYNSLMTDLIRNKRWVDVWRNQKAGKKQYFWYKSKGAAKSRIDYCLSVDVLQDLISECFVTRSPLTDHCLIKITLNASYPRKESKSSWKFYTHLLQNEKYCSEIKELLLNIGNYVCMWNSRRKELALQDQ